MPQMAPPPSSVKSMCIISYNNTYVNKAPKCISLAEFHSIQASCFYPVTEVN